LKTSCKILLHLSSQEVLEGSGAFRCAMWAAVLRALGALPPRDFAWSTMVNPPSIRLINSIEVDRSSASNASNNAVDDGGITSVDSPPRILQNQRLNRQLFQLMHDNDVDLNDGLYQSYQESLAAQRLVHSPELVRRRINALLDGGE
jgi:hypothetical protein